MSRIPIVLVGGGGHARACIDVIEQESRFVVTGVLGGASEVGQSVLGYPIIGTDDDLDRARTLADHALIAVGQIKSPALRGRLFATLSTAGWTFPTIISPRAYVSPHATVGAGTIVLHGAIVNAGARVGRNCIVNSQALVEHDAVVGDDCHIATAATLNGGARVGNGTFVGSGTCVLQGVSIGAQCVIGMGLSVLTDCPDGTGLPGRRSA